MNLKKVIKTALMFGLVASMTACASSTSSTGTTDGGKASTDGKETYKIVLHYEMTGAVADYGNAEVKGSELAIKQANEKAGYEKYVAVKYDNKSDATEAVTIATTLVGDGVVGVVGPATSGASAASYQILNDAKIVVVSPSATQNNITLTDPSKADSPVYDYVYRVCFEDAYQGAAMAQYAFDTLGSKKSVIYGDSASDYSKGLIEAYAKQFTKLGGEIVATEYYTAKDTDFSAVLTNIKAKDFDSLYIAGYYNEAGLIIKQAKEMGINVTILGADGFDSESLAQLAGEKNLNNVFFTTAYTTVGASDSLKAFIEAYKGVYNEEPAMFAALSYDATNVLIEGIEKAGGDPVALQAAITGVDFKGVTGDFTFDKTHTPIKSVLVVSLVDGVQSGAESVSPK